MSSGGWIRSFGLDRNSPLSPREWRVAAAPESRVKLREFRFYQAEAECERTGYEEIYREKRSLSKEQIVSTKLGSQPACAWATAWRAASPTWKGAIHHG